MSAVFNTLVNEFLDFLYVNITYFFINTLNFPFLHYF